MLNKALLFTLILCITFHACITTQKLSIKNDSSIDSICYIFSTKDISIINLHVSNKISLTPDKLYGESELDYIFKFCYGDSITNDFFKAIDTIGDKTTKREYIQEKTTYYLSAMENGEPVDMGASSNWLYQTRLEKVHELPDEISSLFTDFSIFYQVQKSATHTKNKISTIYEGELVPLSKVFNYALKANGKKLNLQLKDKVKILFTLINELDESFSISEFNKIDKGNSNNLLLLDYEFIVNIKNIKAKCGIRMNKEQIVSLYQISKMPPLLLCTPFLISK